jgi:HAD superfamily hydrolase (TIGR01662 family)
MDCKVQNKKCIKEMKIIVIVGFPASGKSTYAKKMLAKYSKNGIILSRDTLGGAITDILPKLKELLESKNKYKIIIDNTNITRETRKPFIKLAQSVNVPIEAHYIVNTIEDSQVKTLHRMFDRYKRLYMTGKAEKNTEAYKDPNVFPPATLFSMRKNIEIPKLDEGFTKILKIEAPSIKWDGRKYRNKAVLFDIDGTLRYTEHLKYKYPIIPDEVEPIKFISLEEQRKKLKNLQINKYKLLGISNQSGISKGVVSENQVIACMNKTREMLGLTEKELNISYCPHNAFPLTCYCRKPQVGQVIAFIETLKLNPSKCIFVGDRKTDETTANRIGIQFITAEDFWKNV